MVGEFSLIEKRGNFFFQGQRAKVKVHEPKLDHEKALVQKSLLKKSSMSIANDTMLMDCLEYISGNQIPAFIRAVKLSSDIRDHDSDSSAGYEEYAYKKLLAAYTAGTLQKKH